ncbi:MAG: tetratricopeptide repeat protein [Kiritimatiellae bacterium]|nr:tetratricopeptide repeat protein [Kiritimatiellia bacterium]
MRKTHWIAATGMKTGLPAGGAVFLLALAMHLLLMLDGRNDPTFWRPIVDAHTYHNFACQMADGLYRPNTPYYQPPFFIYLLAAVYFFTGKSMLAAKLVLAVIGSLTPAISYLIGAGMFSRRTGIIAGALTACYGPLLFMDLQLLPAGTAALLNTLFLWQLLRSAKNDRGSDWVLAGIFAGLAAITVPNVLFFLPFTLFWLVYLYIAYPEGGGRRETKMLAGKAGGRFLLVLLGTACAIAPVTVRNYAVSGRFTLISHNGGLNFYIGNNRKADETTAIRPSFGWENLDKMPMRAEIFDAVDADRFYFRETLKYIRQNPGHFFRNFSRKIRQATNARELPRNVDIYAFRDYYALLRPLVWRLGSFAFPFGIVFPLACWGMLAGLRRSRASLLLAVFIGAYLFSIALFFVAARYRVVVAPALCVLAAYALDWRQWARNCSLRSFMPAAAIVAAAVWANTPIRTPTDHIPFNAEMFNFLALQEINSANYTRAERELREAISIAPDYAPAYNSLGFMRQRQGDLESALAAYREAVRISPDSAESWNGAGSVYEKLGRPDEAEQAYRRAIMLSPETSGPHVNLGRLLYNRERRREAAAALRQAIKLDITAGEAYGLLAWILATAPEDELRNGPESLRHIKFMVRWQGAEDPMRMDTLAAAHAETGDFTNAARAAARAIELWKKAGQEAPAAQAARRLELYRQNKPERE